MDYLTICIKERELEWEKEVANCAERFTAINTLQSSAFRLELADLYLSELEKRCLLYLDYRQGEANFSDFFKIHEMALRSGLKDRFGIEIQAREKCTTLEEKYRILISNSSPLPKSPIGFNI